MNKHALPHPVTTSIRQTLADPEGEAWFFKLKIKDIKELDALMNKDDYDKFAKESSQ